MIVLDKKQNKVLKKLAIITILLFSLHFLGCVRSVKELKQNPAGKYEFIVNEGYKTVHRKAVIALESRSLPGMTEKTRIYTDIKKTKVYNKNTAGFGTIYIACIIESINKNKTSVKIFYSANNRKDKALEVKKEILK